ncbi:hypothetical protein [Fodinicola acaciae]|uniref:hypothetical protein n=1 Tax=Fodinicola acaciae TaxID=2681555 RepID=UPI0013D0BBF7|nr:hypothetical protein [Fodinicola acaciae]
MRRIVRGLAVVGLVAGIGFAVYALTRMAREGSADQFDDFTPAPASPDDKPREDEEPAEEKARPGKVEPQSNQWDIRPPAPRD